MNKKEQLMKAIRIAVDVHDGEYDKGEKPYILHPFHLMNQLLFDTQLATIAVLHDVIEDSDGKVTALTLEKAGFSVRVVSALRLLTHVRSMPYMEYIKGITSNYDAIRVKRKDLEHNSDITRLKGITDKDLARMEKYHRAFLILTEAKRDFERK